MSLLFPRFQEFNPLFRLADELDRAARLNTDVNTRSFAPRFDVRENKDEYELHGELPGVDQSNVNIEWTDDKTLTVSGHTEKRYQSSNAPEVTEVQENTTPTTEGDKDASYHKPTVEEDGAETSSAVATPATTEVAETSSEKTVAKSHERKPRYWVSERSYGSFNRTFQFPSRVNHDGVKAALKNGILTVVVPKAKALEPRKVPIS